MLRRKLLIAYGSLVILLAALAVPTVWGLQRVLAGLDHVNTEARKIVDDVARLNMTITAVEIELYQLQLGRQRHLDTLIADVTAARELIDGIGKHYVVHEPRAAPFYRDLVEKFPALMRQVGSLATAQDAALARKYNIEALSTAMAMRENVRRIDRLTGAHARDEQAELTRHFRWLVVGIALGCLLVINVSIVVLLRAGNMVIAPLTELVETSRKLTGGHADDHLHRPGDDEFVQLTEAYRSLGRQLETQEQRRMETLQQTAVTLNHELNTAMEAIGLQLEVMRRRTHNNEDVEPCLRNIRTSLGRMAETVDSLTRIQRIVVTDYLAGIKMLDLKRSTEVSPPDAEPTANPA
jgi:hypothetical protein